MNNWTAGYVADIGYIYGYYPELNPLRAKLALLSAGQVCPEFGTACELGFGQGVSANIHAATSVTEWYGTDFNPSQAGFAQALAAASGAKARLYDEAFAEFAARHDLPDFDYIGLHGIWSWISDENRAVLVDFVRRKLKVGGVLYVSYNTMPGLSNIAPIRHLMMEHAAVMGSEGQGIVSRINGAIEFSDKLLSSNPVFVRANPQATTRMQMIKDKDRHYLAHEYFNRDWHPMYFSRMTELLSQAKLTFACSAHIPDHVDVINFTTDQQKFLQEIPDLTFREGVRDFMLNQQFRRDFWVKGPRNLGKIEKDQEWAALRVMLVVPRADMPTKITGGLGALSLKAELYQPVLEVLADHAVHTFGELAHAVSSHNISWVQLQEILLLMSCTNQLVIVQSEDVSAKALNTSRKLNTYVLNRARFSNDINVLASPVTGGGIGIDRFQQLFLLGNSTGLKTPAEWAGYAWQVLNSRGEKLIKDGKPLQTAEENLAVLSQQAASFEQKLMPILKKLHIV